MLLLQTQLRQEIKDKFVNKSELEAKEFLTKKDLSNMENNMKVFDEGAKTIDLKLTNEMKKVQSELKTITEGLKEDANVQVKDLERKLTNCETAMTSQNAKFESKLEIVKGDVSLIKQDLDQSMEEMVDSINNQMESLEESLERKIFETVRNDLEKFELSTKVASDEVTKSLQSQMNNIQMDKEKAVQSVNVEVKNLGDAVDTLKDDTTSWKANLGKFCTKKLAILDI